MEICARLILNYTDALAMPVQAFSQFGGAELLAKKYGLSREAGQERSIKLDSARQCLREDICTEVEHCRPFSPGCGQIRRHIAAKSSDIYAGCTTAPLLKPAAHEHWMGLSVQGMSLRQS